MLIVIFTVSCKKSKYDVVYLSGDRDIVLDDGTRIDNGLVIRNPTFNFVNYDKFLEYLTSSDRFLVVSQKDLEKTNSVDKVIISLRHDIDDDIDASLRCAFLEAKHGIHSSYYVLHTAKYYGNTGLRSFKRNDRVVFYLKKIQESYGEEIGIHNDLVTLQLIYELNPRDFLRNEVDWLRDNGIKLYGSTSHGSSFCYVYHYVNSYFWYEIKGSSKGNFYNWQFIEKGNQTIKIIKDSLSSYSFTYEQNTLHPDYFFSDSDYRNNRRLDPTSINYDTIKPGKKVVILIHPQHWE